MPAIHNQDIRLATLADVPALYALLKDFHEGSIWSGIPRIDEHCIKYLAQLIEKSGFVLVQSDKNNTIDAALGILMTSPWYNHEAKLAVELFWYKKPDVSLKAKEWILLAENICKMQKAYGIDFSSVGLRSKALERFYLHAGYAEAERHYVKWFQNGDCIGGR